MSTLNTLRGAFVKDYSVKYKEKLQNGLWFYVLFKYSPSQERPHYLQSSRIEIDAIITDGNLNSWGNNVLSYSEVGEKQDILKSETFPKESDSFYTKDGYLVSQKVFGSHEYSLEIEKGVFEKRKARNLKWVVEVPKEDLINKVM